MYAFIIGTFWNHKKINVFKVKDPIIYENGIQSQREELGTKAHILKHLTIIRDQQENIYYDWWIK